MGSQVVREFAAATPGDDNTSMPTAVQNTITEFLTFVQRSGQILSQPTGSHSSVTSFQQFLAAATPLVLPRVKASLPLLVERAALVHGWLTPYDILEVAGLSYAENPYIELVAWLLDPTTHPPTAVRRQRAWLRVLGLADGISCNVPASPRTQLRTEDGIPDLILDYFSDILIVEVKTKTFEHVAPSGTLQTMAYPVSVAKRLASEDAKSHVVFLTPDGRRPENPAAIATTFLELVVALGTQLKPEELPPDLRWAFSMVLTHLLTQTDPSGIDVHGLLGTVVEWGKEETLLRNEKLLMARLKTIEDATKLLLPESRS